MLPAFVQVASSLRRTLQRQRSNGAEPKHTFLGRAVSGQYRLLTLPEIVSSRTVNASTDLVYAAWTDPDHLKNWWGPAGFTNTFNEFDLRPGGRWSFIMHGPEKGNYPNECEFITIDKPSLIAWRRISKPIFQVVATFEEVSADKVEIVFKMIFDSVEECNKVKVFAVEKNEENFDRLEHELAKMAEIKHDNFD